MPRSWLASWRSSTPRRDRTNYPGYKLHPLKAQERGRWSIWVSANWRVKFRVSGNDVELVDYLAYH
ncbi:MAG: hypothetical protein ACRED5_19675 [Propylenella sp.]